MRIQKPERLTGYILLILGLVLILIPVMMSILTLLGNMGIPEFVPKPSVNLNDPNAEIARMMAEAFPLLNIVPVFLLFVVLVYAGSILMGKGIGLIKEIQWKISQVSKEETVVEEESSKQAERPAKKKAQKQQESEEE